MDKNKNESAKIKVAVSQAPKMHYDIENDYS